MKYEPNREYVERRNRLADFAERVANKAVGKNPQTDQEIFRWNKIYHSILKRLTEITKEN